MPLMFAPLVTAGLGALARLGPAAYRGYKTYKKARNLGGLGRFSKAAQPKSGGFPLGYQGTLAQRIVGTPSKGLGSGTGLQGLMARGAKKFPTTSAAIEGGSGALIGGQGVGDFVEGYQEGDIPQMLMGIEDFQKQHNQNQVVFH